MIKDIKMKNLPELLKTSINKHNKKTAFLTESENISYSDFWDKSLNFASFLIKKGLKPENKVAFVSNNSAKKAIVESAVLCSAAAVVPLLLNITESNFETIITSQKISHIVFENCKTYKKLAKNSKIISKLKCIIIINTEDEGIEKASNVKSFDEALELGVGYSSKNLKHVLNRISEISDDQAAFIFFTSIHHNNPRGVILSHKAIYSGVKQIISSFGLKANKTIVFSLPSTIAFSTTLLYASFALGLKIKFANLQSKQNFESFRQFKPDIFAAMPDIWEKIYFDYVKGIRKDSLARGRFYDLLIRGAEVFYFFLDSFKHPVKFTNKFYTFLFRLALCLPIAFFSIPYVLFNLLISPDIKKIFGSKLTIGITGNRHIYRSTVVFFRSAGIFLIKSYGHPETGGLIATTGKKNMFSSSDGKIIKNINYRIINRHGENAHDIKAGRLFIQSPSLFSGYTTGPEDTSKVLYENWYDTGDIVRFMRNGLFVVVKRASEILKLNSGLEVDKEYIEHALALSPCIDRAVLTLDKLENKINIIIYPDFDFLVSYARQNNISYFDFDELLQKQSVILFYRNKIKKFIKENLNLLNINDIEKIILKKKDY